MLCWQIVVSRASLGSSSHFSGLKTLLDTLLFNNYAEDSPVIQSFDEPMEEDLPSVDDIAFLDVPENVNKTVVNNIECHINNLFKGSFCVPASVCVLSEPAFHIIHAAARTHDLLGFRSE